MGRVTAGRPATASAPGRGQGGAATHDNGTGTGACTEPPAAAGGQGVLRRYLTPEEAAEYVGLPLDFFLDIIKEGHGPECCEKSTKNRTFRRYRIDRLEEWMDS